MFASKKGQKDYNISGSSQDRLCMSVPEVAKVLGISRGLAYELARSGKLPAIRLGKRLLVSKIGLERMLGQREQIAKNDMEGRVDVETEKEVTKPIKVRRRTSYY